MMIGDRDIDILSAKANGLPSIGVLWGFGDMNELSGAGASASVILSSTNELVLLSV